jgi:hypothetical protein
MVVMDVFKSKLLRFKTFKTRLGDYPVPLPAVKCLPDWYRKMASSMKGKGEPRTTIEDDRLVLYSTIKQCMPVLDVLSIGYMLRLPVDLQVTKLENGEYTFHWTAENPFDSWIENHPMGQVNAKYFTDRQSGSYVYKVICPFTINTPKGYSCLFIPPLYRDNKIKILEGLVCTDTFPIVNFPFFINTDEDEFILEAGTPIAQIIPIKRENWSSESLQGDLNENGQYLSKLTSLILNRYKRLFRESVKYR